MKVETLIKQLEKMPKDYDVYVHENGSVYDFPISCVTIDKYDEEKNFKKVTLK